MFNYYMNIVIKPRTEIDLPNVETCIKTAFDNYDKIIFTFDLTETSVFNFQCLMKILPLLKNFEKDIEEKLQKSFIVVQKQWKKTLLMLFFAYYKPKKPVEFIDNYTQNHGFNSNVLL